MQTRCKYIHMQNTNTTQGQTQHKQKHSAITTENASKKHSTQSSLTFICCCTDYAVLCLLPACIIPCSWTTPPLHSLLLFVASTCCHKCSSYILVYILARTTYIKSLQVCHFIIYQSVHALQNEILHYEKFCPSTLNCVIYTC